MESQKIRVFRIRHLVLYVSFVFLTLVTACEKDSADYDTTQLLGTWHQLSRTVDGNTAPLDSTRLILQINADNICIMCDSTALALKSNSILKRSGWSYNGGLLNIAIDLPASYNATASADKLILERIDFNKQGLITRTVIDFESIEKIEFE